MILTDSQKVERGDSGSGFHLLPDFQRRSAEPDLPRHRINADRVSLALRNVVQALIVVPNLLSVQRIRFGPLRGHG